MMREMLLAVFFFILGAIAASFAGVVAARSHTGESFLAGRSRCDACGALLAPAALVPMFSYLAARGRARCCGARLSLISPASELSLGVFFALAYAKLGLTIALPFILLALVFLTALVLYDLAHQILPTVLLIPFVLAAFAAGYLSAPSLGAFVFLLFAALLISASLMLIHIFSRGRAMGFADAPLAFGLALLSGPASLAGSGFIYAFWIGAAVGIVLLARRPRGSRMGIEVPFAPYLAAGFLVAYFTQWNLLAFLAVLP